MDPQAGPARKRILFVCYGNICRSPLAEALLRRELAAAGLDERFSVGSAGVAALVGQPAAPGTLMVAAVSGLALEGHRARQLTPELARETDVFVALDEFVEDRILDLAGDFVGDIPVELWPVEDPYGGSEAGYWRAFRALEEHVGRYVAALRTSGPARD